MNNLICAVVTGNLQHLLQGFLVLVVILAIIWGLLWCVENWISPVPPPVKLVLAIVILILVVLWAMGALTGNSLL